MAATVDLSSSKVSHKASAMQVLLYSIARAILWSIGSSELTQDSWVCKKLSASDTSMNLVWPGHSQTVKRQQGGREVKRALKNFFLSKYSFTDYRIFHIYSEAASLMTIWSVQQFPVNFLGMGIWRHEQCCQNTAPVLLSRRETPTEITWSLSIIFSLSWSNLRRNTQGKVPSATSMRNLGKKKNFGNFITYELPIVDTHFHGKMNPCDHCLMFKGTQNLTTSDGCGTFLYNTCAPRTK